MAPLSKLVFLLSQVVVRAEGPTRVLSVTDLALHVPPRALSPAEASATVAWEAWSGGQVFAAVAGRIMQASPSRPIPTSIQWEVKLNLAGVAVSVVSSQQELLYTRLSGVRVRVTGSQARQTLELMIQHMQADNTLPSATYLVCPLFLCSCCSPSFFTFPPWHSPLLVCCVDAQSLNYYMNTICQLVLKGLRIMATVTCVGPCRFCSRHQQCHPPGLA